VKLISSAYGIVILHASADDTCPARGILQRDLVQYVGDAYQFSVRPPPTLPPQPITFQSGKLVTASSEYPVHQLSIFTKADAVTSISTDDAEIVLEDYMARLDRDLGYRFKSNTASPQRRTYHSGIVVHFEKGIEERIAIFQKMEEILNREIPRERAPLKPKTISFGYGDPSNPSIADLVESMDKADFILQRRANEPYSANRYFCSAPLKTSDLVRVMKTIDAAIGSG
jgi:hypothetical protein